MLSGFSKHFLAQSFNTNEELAEKLQSPKDERKQIVTVEGGLNVISPKWQEQQEEGEDEDEDEAPSRNPYRPSHGRQEQEDEEYEEEDQPRHPPHPCPHPHRPSHEKLEREEEDKNEDQSRHRPHPHRSRREQPSRPRQQKEGERHEPRPRGRNRVEENICSLKLHQNIARRERADSYNPKAGRITTINSLTLPILRRFGLSAQYVVLYKNGIYSPNWNLNTNSVIYLTRGQGKVRVVNCEGNAVFEDELRKGQLLVVPQNFVVAEEAGEQGFEYVVFKTHHNAMSSYLKEVFRALPSEVIANSYNRPQSQVRDLKYYGNWGPLVNPQSPQPSCIAMVA